MQKTVDRLTVQGIDRLLQLTESSTLEPASKFGQILYSILIRNYVNLQSIRSLIGCQNRFVGDAAITLVRRLFEDMVWVEYMMLVGKEEMAQQFVDFHPVDRWIDKQYLKGAGWSDPEVEARVDSNFDKVSQLFIRKPKESDWRKKYWRNWAKVSIDEALNQLKLHGVLDDGAMQQYVHIYTMGNRKNHLSPYDVSLVCGGARINGKVNLSLIDTSKELELAASLAFLFYQRIFAALASELGNASLETKLEEIFQKVHGHILSKTVTSRDLRLP